MDLTSSWTQPIDCGRLTGRSIELNRVVGARSIKDVQLAWKIYIDLSRARHSLWRRYYASFTCSGDHYTLRDMTILSPPPCVGQMIAQLLELFSNPIPSHGNPTVTSISFLGRLPVALKHKVPRTYYSSYLIQIDYGGLDTAALKLMTQRLIDEPLGVIVVDAAKLAIRREATFQSFIREYPNHSQLLGLYFLVRGLLSLYPSSSDTEPFSRLVGGRSSAKTLREAFEETKKSPPIPLCLAESLSSLCGSVTA